MINFISYFYRFFKRLLFLVEKLRKKTLNYYFPNFKSILAGKIILPRDISFNQPTLVEGKGEVEIGGGCSFGYKLGGFHRHGSIELQARYENSKIKIGNKVRTNNNIFLCAAKYIEIGSKTLIGQGVVFMDHEPHGIDPTKRSQIGEIGIIIIGENVWIGNNVTILKNSEIGKNSIVAAGAVVSGVFPENSIIGGIPAKIIRKL